MHIFFDLLITTGFAATALPAVILLYHRKKTTDCWEYKHRKTSLTLSLLLLFSTAVLIYGSFIEPKLLVLNEQTIDLPNIEEPIRIAFFADPQVGPYKRTEHIEKIVNFILQHNPDLVFIGGDMVNNGLKKTDETVYLKPLEKLAQQIPTYAVHGNHEYGVNCGSVKKGCKFYHANESKQVEEEIKKLGVHFLVNDLELITIRDQSFYLFGGDSWWAGQLDFSMLQQRDQPAISTMALIHNPAALPEASQHKIDLMLSGHTHGGQIRLPLIGAIKKVDTILPKELYQGLYNHNDMQLFVTSGTGETGARARLFNPPEIVLLTIK